MTTPLGKLSFGIVLLFVAMVMLAVFGVVMSIRRIDHSNSAFLLGYRFEVVALITMLGHRLTDMGRYGLFKRPKYGTNSERVVLAAALVGAPGLIVKRSPF